MSALKKTIALLVTMVVISRVTSIPQPAEDVKKNEIENTNKEKEAISNPKKADTTVDKVVEPEVKDKQKEVKVVTSTPVVYITRVPPTESPFGGFSKFFTDIFQIPINILKSVGSLISNSFAARH